jgi:hypothetical protein
VQVQINAGGRVTGAVSKVAEPGLDRYLADQAVKAAHQWSFVPVHSRSGRAIASSKERRIRVRTGTIGFVRGGERRSEAD